MNGNHILVFGLNITHSYFTTDVCEDLTCNPTNDTKAIIDRYGFTIRKTTSGFQIYTTTNQPIENYLNYIKKVTEKDTFEFTGTTSNQLFYKYTAEIPITEIGLLSYKSNSSTTLEKTWISKKDTKHAITIKIQFHDIIQGIKSNSSIQYQIHLSARKTQWQYYIINSSNQEYTEIAIESNTTEIQFTNKGETALQNKQKAILFSSGNTLIPLKNTAEFNFNIISTKQTITGNRKQILFKGLPIPNTSNQIILDNNCIASPMYIYI